MSKFLNNLIKIFESYDFISCFLREEKVIRKKYVFIFFITDCRSYHLNLSFL